MGTLVHPACLGCKEYLDLGPGYKPSEIELSPEKLMAIGRFVMRHSAKGCAVALVSGSSYGVFREIDGFEKEPPATSTNLADSARFDEAAPIKKETWEKI